MKISYNEVSLACMFLLQEAGIPLSVEQISTAMANYSEYTFMDVAMAVDVMCDKGFIREEKGPISSAFTITVEGRVNLSHLLHEIRGTLRKSLSEYAAQHKAALSMESRLYTRCIAKEDGSYQLILRAFDNDMTQNDITLTVQSEAEAKVMEKNWIENADKVLAVLYTELLK